MTIRPGEEWGSPVDRPDGLVVASDDLALAGLVASGHDGPLGVAAGDVHRSLGSPAPREGMQRLPMDALLVMADGRTLTAVAHVVARRSWWIGAVVGVFNVDQHGSWKVAPRAHPNDGRFDVAEVAPSMGPRQRFLAWRRLPAGTHVPHPAIATRSATSAEWRFAHPLTLWVDGVRDGTVRELSVAIAPDAYELHV